MTERIVGFTEAIRACGVGLAKEQGQAAAFSARLEPETDGDTGVPAKPGIPTRRRFLLIAESGAFVPGEVCDRLYHGEEVYEVLRLEPIRYGEQISHWEGTVKLKTGGAALD